MTKSNMLYMLDTDIASYAIKNRSKAVVDRLSALPPSDICVSAVTQAELLYGLTRLAPAHRLHLVVHEFLKVVRVLAWGTDATAYYARIKRQLVSAGQPIGELDMMIAAHSIAAGAVLVTNNHRHYSRIELPISLADWPI